MIILVPVGLLLIASAAIYILDSTRPRYGTSWLIASISSLIVWLMMFFLRLRLPSAVELLAWNAPDLNLIGQISLLLDYDSWPYALALVTITLAVILSDAARTRYDSSPRAWSASLVISALGLLAIQSGTSLTMMLTWVLLDLIELVYLLGLEDSSRFNLRIIISFGVRTASILCLFLGTMLGWAARGDFSLAQVPSEAGFIFLLAAGLRLGVFPLNLPFLKEPALRRGAGNIIRLTPVAASLALLTRIPADLLEPKLVGWKPLFMGLLAVAALYAGIRWLVAADEVEGRPYWIVAWASFAVASVLNGSPRASIAWGMALILPGSLLFLYYPRIQRLNYLLFFGLVGVLALPYTPAASGWEGLMGSGFNLWTLIFVVVHVLLVLGYLERAFLPGGEPGALESWARVVFPLALILIIQSIIALGLIGWPGALTAGIWWLSLISNGLILAAILLIRRFGVIPPYFQLPASSRLRKFFDWLLPRLEPIFRFEWFYRVGWQIYKIFGMLIKPFSSLLEGAGGILWTLLILVLLVTFLISGGGL